MVRGQDNQDAINLEEAFFAQENKRLLERLREKAELKDRREALRAVVETDDDDFLDHLLELGIGAETALALTLVPLAAVAWADGTLDAKEREAILKSAEGRGLDKESAAHVLLESWLDNRPPASLVETWKRYVKTIWSNLGEQERKAVHDRMIGRARIVAEASGGFLGLTSKISPAEQAVLDDLEAILA